MHSDARLVDGGVPNQGRVEIYINSSWWSVCSYWFSYSAARVVCQNLGQPEPSKVYSNAWDSFGQGNGSILTQQYDCYGNESSVLNCTKGDYDYYCGHSRDVGIACGPLVLAECSHLLTEPSGHISFKRGEKISETQCQWTIGNISHPNGESVVLVYDPDKYDYCSFAVSVLDGFGNIIFEKYCAPPLPRSIFDSSSLGVTVKVRARNKYRTFNFHYAILNGSIDSASQVDGWNVTAVDASQTSITIQWPKLTNVFGNLIRSYIVVVESTYGEKVAGNIVSPNFTSIEVDGLNTTTEYRVFAVVLDDLGQPFRSSPVLTSTEEGVPSRSPYVQYTILGVDSVHLSISPIPEQHHNGKLLGYIILYRASCYLLNSSGQVNVSVSTTSYTLNGLLPGTKYEIRVAAFTSKGTGQYHYINVFTTCEGQRTSTERNGTLHSPNYPCAYGGLQYCRWTIKPQLSGNAVKAIWIKFKTFDVGHRGVFHCELGDWLSVVAGENAHADNDTLICDYVRPFSFVVPGDVAEIAFRTHNSYSYSSGFFASYIGLQDTFIDIPLSSWHLSVYNITSSSLRVEWEDFPLNISISKFMVMFTQENKNISVLFEVKSLYDRYYDIKHLIKPYRMYKFHVLACTGSIENETYSTEIKTILTGEGVPARSPYIYDYRVIDYSTIWIKWSRISQRDIPGILQGYRIHISLDKYPWNSFRNITVGPDREEATITGLRSDTYYIVWVKAFTSKGEGREEYVRYIKTKCGAAVHSSSGVIQSPGYPQRIEHSQCTWDIDPGSRNKSVLVTFQHFNLPLSYECKEFFVSVRDESGIKPELLCVENKPFIFLARKLRIEYRSNRYTNSWTGFEAHYVVLNESIVNAPLVGNWNINIPSVQLSSISVVWAHYVPDNHYSLHFYAVICTPITSESGPIVVIANTTQTDIEVRRLRGLTEYTVQVLALTIHPDSVSLSLKGSQKLVITTTEGVPSEPPGNVTAMSSDASAITVSWSHIQNDSVNGMLLGYMVFYKSLYDDGNYSTNTVGPSTLQVIISEHLIYTDIYEIKVAGITGAGVGVMSKSMVVRPGCIGLIHEKMGTVTSPGFPNNYPSDLVCYWIWRPTLTKYRFALAFDTFRTEDVEGRPNCTNFKNDHIQVGIVNVKWNPLPYCGIRNPFALILEGNTTDPARMLFRSNGGLERTRI
ncbi:Protein sidekick-1 [Desmophyllum pertusum]|uniref:Protein sidekick-1 n=1 Tax=Desmophyllum pertusum TaxID=174260 RepID=A0A9X0CU37_9CNID|nr:Protein sidekick-1 [Desmophyllum pertusum]